MNTLDYYNKNSEEYFNSTLNVDMTNTYKEFLKLVPEGWKNIRFRLWIRKR